MPAGPAALQEEAVLEYCSRSLPHSLCHIFSASLGPGVAQNSSLKSHGSHLPNPALTLHLPKSAPQHLSTSVPSQEDKEQTLALQTAAHVINVTQGAVSQTFGKSGVRLVTCCWGGVGPTHLFTCCCLWGSSFVFYKANRWRKKKKKG